MNLKEIIRNSLLYKFYKSIHIRERIQFYHQRNEMKVFAKKGDTIIEYVHEVLNKTNKMFFVDAGTLIGIYRDGQLLKRDMDVDIGIVVKDQNDVIKIRQLMIDNGFYLKIKFCIPRHGIIQDAFNYDGVRVDMCYFVEEANSDICYVLYGDNRIIKMTFSKIKQTKKYKYKNQEVNIPENSDRYLEERYGKSWLKPDPFFKYWEGPCVSPVEGRGVCEFV